MNNISINTFTKNVKDWVKKVITNHEPLQINNDNGEDFIIISVEDWQREQETLSILQNSDLMKQITTSIQTHINHQGYQPTVDIMINSIN